MRRLGWAIALLLIAAGAMALRLPDLGNRPMHGDEAVHAVKFAQLWTTGRYEYDPNEFHGPTLYYAAFPSIWAHGRHDFAQTQESDYRLVTVLFGAGLVLLLALIADALGWPAALCAAVLTALSPAMVFYSRYYIQEMLLVFFTLGMIGCAWRYTRRPGAGWALGTGACAGLMLASKETAALTFAAAAAAVGLTVLWTRMVDRRDAPWRAWVKPAHAALAVGAAFVVAFVFLSGFFTHLAGPAGLIKAYTPWLQRARGTELHQHPWTYYLRMLVYWHEKTPTGHDPTFTEGLIVGLAVIGAVAALLPARSSRGVSPGFARFATFYTLILTVAYSVIRYKTPWCILSFLEGMILLAGIGAVVLVHAIPTAPAKGLAIGLLLVAAYYFGQLSYRTSYVYYVDDRNPYVYAQPLREIVDIEKRVDQLAALSPQRRNLTIQVVWTDDYYWPLPWYLRAYKNVGWYNSIPDQLAAPIILTNSDLQDTLEPKLHDGYFMTGLNPIRPAVFANVWVANDLWVAYVKTLPPGRAQIGE